MSKYKYKKIKGVVGIYRQENSGNYLAMKKVNGKNFQKTFTSLYDAKKWQKHFDGTEKSRPPIVEREVEDIPFPPSPPVYAGRYSTLREVWMEMQRTHFPLLATSTRNMWQRRFVLWEHVADTPMNEITPSFVTTWVQHWVKHFSDEDYQGRRGTAGRCNLNNELNIFVTIFNWYKQSEQFEKEALHLTNPVKTKHKKMGFIKPIPDKKKQIDVESAFRFFEFLQPLYRDLAQMQFYCAGRIGEIAGLQWSNVDLRNRRMLIKHTCVFTPSSKVFLELKPFPKNRESRAVFITDEIMEILKRREAFRVLGCDFVFHIEGRPLNYCTIQLNYREAQRKSGVPYTGTHILRHGMAKLARQVGGGLDAVLAMTGHKDLKLADHYSKCDEDDQKLFSERIMEHLRGVRGKSVQASFDNVVSLKQRRRAINE
jgi:integrase